MDDENAEVVSLPQAPDAIELRHLRAFVAVAPRPASTWPGIPPTIP
jgi:hypothetical protein